MNYTIHQLNVFVKVCEIGSITRASEVLHLTQPAVSIQLKKLQDQFEIPLIEVIGKKLFVTDFGKQILVIAERILSETKSIDTMVNQYKGLLTGSIQISVVSTGKYVIPYFLTEFIRKHPAVDIVINVTNKNLVVENLLQNTTDLALVSVLPDLKLNKVELMANVLELYKGKDYPELSSENLDEVTFIYREYGSATRSAMEEYLLKQHIIPNKTMQLTSNEAVKQAIIAGLGVSIMPEIGLRSALDLGLVKKIPMPGLPIITNWNIVYLKEKLLNPACNALLEHLEKNKNQVINTYFSRRT